MRDNFIWSNTLIVVELKGRGKVSYLSLAVIQLMNATLTYRLVGPSDTAPTPTTGYIILSTPVTISGIQGKFWIEYKIT